MPQKGSPSLGESQDSNAERFTSQLDVLNLLLSPAPFAKQPPFDNATGLLASIVYKNLTVETLQRLNITFGALAAAEGRLSSSVTTAGSVVRRRELRSVLDDLCTAKDSFFFLGSRLHSRVNASASTVSQLIDDPCLNVLLEGLDYLCSIKTETIAPVMRHSLQMLKDAVSLIGQDTDDHFVPDIQQLALGAAVLISCTCRLFLPLQTQRSITPYVHMEGCLLTMENECLRERHDWSLLFTAASETVHTFFSTVEAFPKERTLTEEVVVSMGLYNDDRVNLPRMESLIVELRAVRDEVVHLIAKARSRPPASGLDHTMGMITEMKEDRRLVKALLRF